MPLIFEGSKKYTIGVELELQIVDPKSLDLTPQSMPLLAACQKAKLSRVKTEIHQSMVEIDTEISETVRECSQFLKKRLSALHNLAHSLDLRISASGTHPFQKWADRLISHDLRYQNLYHKFQWLARRMNVYGLHIHIGLPSGEEALKVSRNLTPYLPHLLALSANSPYWQGIDTGMQSCRVSIMESFPLAGIPPYFENWQSFEHYILTLQKAGAIGSLKDLYWYIRPNLSFGTIEFRICDVLSNFSETMAIVALVQCLVAFAANDPENTPIEKIWVTPENLWTAARDGLQGYIITGAQGQRGKMADEVYALIEKLEPISKDLNCQEELLLLKNILLNGNGAQKQREIYEKTESFSQLMNRCLQEFELSVKEDECLEFIP